MKWSLLTLVVLLPLLSLSQTNEVPGLPPLSPEKAGFNAQELGYVVSNIWTMPPGDFRGLVVIKDHQLVLEEHFHTFWRISIHDIRSAGKSVTALLLGIALKGGLIDNVDQTVYQLLPKEKYPTLHNDYKNIKISHLLNMMSGLDADTDNTETPGHAVHWGALNEWKRYILGIAATSKPGKKWVYADINPLVIAAIIEEKSGMSLRDYAKEKLFDPLGISQYYW
ncbi:MAG: serine hydrolase, partial [Bacteroidota bacterium]